MNCAYRANFAYNKRIRLVYSKYKLCELVRYAFFRANISVLLSIDHFIVYYRNNFSAFLHLFSSIIALFASCLLIEPHTERERERNTNHKLVVVTMISAQTHNNHHPNGDEIEQPM